MALLDRILGGSRSKAHAEGMALLEEGRFAEAADRLRVVALDRSDSPKGSLAAVHFRQALIREGRRLARAGSFREAAVPLAEAVGLWDMYPDLHCLHGAMLGFAGNWDEALSEGRTALRIHPDYVEARLLEAVALIRLLRPQEAAASLNSLLESRRRINHWVFDLFRDTEQVAADSLPEDLDEVLLRAISGRSEKEEVAEAVSVFRAGEWDKGLDLFAALVAKRPRYPDYRTRHAAALFQVGRGQEALTEVEAALGLNENYRLAVDLKGLILADRGQLTEARDFLADADERMGSGAQMQVHEELFAAYLRAALALLTGDPEKVPEILQGWNDLSRNFARAELLLAAAEDLRDRPRSCQQRLKHLAAEWKAEPLYHHLLACCLLQNQQYDDVPGVLSRWPQDSMPDLRPRYLDGCLAVCQGMVPDLPEDPSAASDPGVPLAAWDFLRARTEYLQGQDAACHRICTRLLERGHATERIVRLMISAAANLGKKEPVEPLVLPDSCLPGRLVQLQAAHEGDRIESLLEKQTDPHPENLAGCWLSPRFWFEPVRGWIA